jgi:polyhydroxyalkanoate synthesis repressor PhaR
MFAVHLHNMLAFRLDSEAGVTSKAKAAKGGKNGGAKASGARAGKAAAGEGKRRRGRPPRAQAEAAQAAFPGERMIHRYGNRRFYDLAQSRAVTMEQIAELVRDRKNVRILDVERGNSDITRRVLTQILMESGEQLDAVPVEFLRKLIVPFEQLTGSWIRNYLTKGLDLLERAERQGKPSEAESPPPKRVIEVMPHVDYRQQMAKADITRQIDELRRKLEVL